MNDEQLPKRMLSKEEVESLLEVFKHELRKHSPHGCDALPSIHQGRLCDGFSFWVEVQVSVIGESVRRQYVGPPIPPDSLLESGIAPMECLERQMKIWAEDMAWRLDQIEQPLEGEDAPSGEVLP